MFKSRKLEESDKEFFEKVKCLNEERKLASRYSNATLTECFSIKEEVCFNKDMLNLINSPNVCTNI